MKFEPLQFLRDIFLDRYPRRPFLIAADQTMSFREAFDEIMSIRDRALLELPSSLPQIGLIAEHSVQTPISLLGLALSGRSVLLLKDHYGVKQGASNGASWSAIPVWGVSNDGVIDENKSWTSNVNVQSTSRFFTVLSSGTTGTSKAITHSFESVFESALNFSKALDFQPTDTFFHNWPMNYMAGIFNLILCPIVSGSSVVLDKPFSVASARTQIGRIGTVQPSQLLISPTMAKVFSTVGYHQQISLNRTNVVCTSSLLYPSVAREFEACFDVSVRPCYGITEFGGSFTIGDDSAVPFSVGKPVPNVELQIINEEVHVRSPYVAVQIENGDGSVELLSDKVFYATNDLGELHADGELVLSGRAGERIKKGGEFLSLIQIENFVLETSEVSDVLCIPVGSEFWGQDYVLKVVPTSANIDSQALVSDIKTQISEKLSANALPIRIEIEMSIVRTDSGKPLRRHYLNLNAPETGS